MCDTARLLSGSHARAVLATWLISIFAATAAYGSQPISGTFYDIEGNGVSGKWIRAMQAGEADSTQTKPAYTLFQDPTSSIPDTPGDPTAPLVQLIGWGRLKATFLPKTSVMASVESDRAKHPLSVLSEGILELDGGSTHWSVTHDFGSLVEPLIYNASLPPRVWTVPGLFTDVEAEPEIYKRLLRVRPYPTTGWTDNISWPISAFPIPVDGTGFDQADLDSLVQRQLHLSARTGLPELFYYAPGQVQIGVSGIWIIFNDPYENSTQFFYDSQTFTMNAAIIHVTTNGWESRPMGEHELFRAVFGYRGNLVHIDPRYGLANTDPSPMTEYDAAFARFVYLDRLMTETQKNNVRLADVH